jgi:Holliday junction resolvasome RuvABC endonuclease subunit
MITVAGVDLGLRKAHIFAIRDSDSPDLFHVSLDRSNRRDLELKKIHREIKEYYAGECAPFFVEEPLVAGARNLRVSLGIAQTAGAVMTALRGPAYFVSVASWKMTVVGSGRASKDDVRLWLSENKQSYSLACEGTNSPQDYADAACIAVYGSQMLGLDL